MIKQGGKRYLFLLIGLFVVALIVYGITYMTIIKPMKADLGTVEKQVDMFEKQLEKVTDQSTSESEEIENPEEMVEIPVNKAPDNLLRGLQKMAQSSNVTIQLLQLSGGEDIEKMDLPNEVKGITYSLEATAGDLNKMNAFLTTLKNSERLLSIDTINLDNYKDETYLAVTFTTYYAAD